MGDPCNEGKEGKEEKVSCQDDSGAIAVGSTKNISTNDNKPEKKKISKDGKNGKGKEQKLQKILIIGRRLRKRK